MKRIAALLLLTLGCEPSVGPNTSSRVSLSRSRSSSRADAPATGPTVTIVSYNVNYGLASCSGSSGQTRCSADPETIGVLEKLDADVVLLQETTPAWERALRPRMKQYAHVTFHDPSTSAPSGLGAFSKFPIEADDVLPSPLRWFPANRLVLRTPDGPLQILDVHLRPAVSESGSWVSGYFTTGPLRDREMVTYTPHLDATLPTVVAGDFNENENGDAFAELVKLGFKSALPEVSPSATTWRWVAYGIPLALRLDHVAYESERFDLVSAEVIQGGRSDHLPVRVVLRRRP